LATIVLRHGVQVENPPELALGFLSTYSSYGADASARPVSFDERDLRAAKPGWCAHLGGPDRSDSRRAGQAPTGVARDPRRRIVGGRRELDPMDPVDAALRGVFGYLRSRLFEDDQGSAPEAAALVPMLDSVVQAYLTSGDPGTGTSGSCGQRATALVRSYKEDLDRNRSALREIRQELAKREYPLTEVRILDLPIWSESAAT
jgi:hypothetical protein